MGGRQSTNNANAGGNVTTSNNSRYGGCVTNNNGHNHANPNESTTQQSAAIVSPGTALGNGTSRSVTGASRLHNSSNNSANNSSSDWRQRTRSLSSVINGHPQPPINVGGHSAFGLSASPDSDTSTEDSLSFGRVFSAHSLPVQLVSFNGIKCPVCSKFVLPDDVECHLVMCLTKPRINYNEEVLLEDKNVECVICLDEFSQGETIARLPCLCIYHKSCIDAWFDVNRSCPEHPSD